MALNPFVSRKNSELNPNQENSSEVNNRDENNASPYGETILLPTAPNDSGFGDFFEDDEETVALNIAKGGQSLPAINATNKDTIAIALEKNFHELKKKYPDGGIKSSRFISTELLMMAPENYFSRFEEDVQKTVDWIQLTLATKELSDVVGQANKNPTNDEFQEKGFRAVKNLAIEYLERLNYRGIEKEIVKTLACNEIIGFGRLDPLWRDRSIDEIMCNGPFDIQVEIRGKVHKVPAVRFRDAEHLAALIGRLYGAIDKQLSRTTPLLKGRLHDSSRMYAVHHSVAPLGPNFNIRRHPEKYWTPAEIVSNGTSSAEMMTFIGNLVNKGCSFLVSGGTSSGKTSLLNALTGFYRDRARIITLEDNIEMKPNPNKLLAAAMECKAPMPDRPNDRGVTMRDLVKASTQMRPECLIIGEVTDDAAYDLVQALNTGHYGASTTHANSEPEAVSRIASLMSQSGLVTLDGSLPLMAAAFDIVIQVVKFPVDGSRHIASISEVAPFPEMGAHGAMILPMHQLWKFVSDGIEDGKVKGHYEQVGEMSQFRSQRRQLNMERDMTWEELLEISKI